MSIFLAKNVGKTRNILFFWMIFLSSCMEHHDKLTVDKYIDPIVQNSENAVDQIKGDKILPDGTIRTNNFSAFFDLTSENLKLFSQLYDVEEIDDSHYILRQKIRYTDARNFDIFLKVESDSVANYYVFNDFLISDIVQTSNQDWIILLSDIYQTNLYWKAVNAIKLVKLSADFKELFCYEKKAEHPLRGRSVTVHGENLAIQIEVIQSSHVVYNVVELLFTQEGKFISVRQIGTENSADPLSQETLNKMF